MSDFGEELSEEAVVIVERLEPSTPPGAAGFYGSFPRSELSRIEELVRLKWGRGRYLFEIRDEGETVRKWSRTLAGKPPRDTEGELIEWRGQARVSEDSLSMRLEGSGGVVNDKFLLELVERKDRELEELRKTLEEHRDRNEARQAELSERVAELRQREAELRGQLERERQIAERERQNAQVAALSAKIDALANKPEGNSFKEAFELALSTLPKPRQTGLKELRDMKEVLDDLRGDRGDDDDDWSKVIGAAIGEFVKTHKDQVDEAADPEAPPTRKAIAPSPPMVGPNASRRFLELLASGLEDFPEPASWVREALPTLTPVGRRRLLELDMQDSRQILTWLADVPGLNLSKAVAAIGGHARRQDWLGEVLGTAIKILRGDVHAA